MPRNPIDKKAEDCAFNLGTTVSGNLPQHKVKNPCGVDISNITYPGVTEFSFRYYHIKCPFSSEATYNKYRDINPFSATYWQMVPVVSGSINTHTDTLGLMIKETRGNKYGWICPDDNCSYYLSTGERYFYI